MSRFQMPTEPKNGLDLLRWAVFEPVLLSLFSERLSRKEALCWFLKAYPYIVILSAVFHVSGLFITITFVSPLYFPQFYESEFINQWQQHSTIASQVVCFFSLAIIGVVNGFIKGFLYGMIFLSIKKEMPDGFIINIIRNRGASEPGIIVELVDAAFFGIISGFFFGLINGIIYGLGRSLIGYAACGIFYGIVGKPFLGSVGNFIFLGFCIMNLSATPPSPFIPVIYILFYYLLIEVRLIFYPFHFIYAIYAHNFNKNPYLNDGVIRLPLFLLDEQLIRFAFRDPKIVAIKFVEFLLYYRPLQERLAARILHAFTAGIWRQQAYKLDADTLFAPWFPAPKNSWFPEKLRKYYPSSYWHAKLTQLQIQLISSQTQTQITLKKEAFEQFFEMLKAFRSQTLLESRKWNHFYLDAIDEWLKKSAEHLETLKQQAELLEPMASNLYKSGEALQVQFDNRIFVGRDDLKDALSFEIMTAKQMPLFLIQGQRRVGKTSLLNFLPLLLGPRFEIVPYDLQGLEDRTLGGFFFALRNTINKAFAIREETAWNPPEDWLRAWGEFREYVEQLTNGKDFKLVLAFDEYEILHDDIFQRDPQQAARLLGAMRSFSQSQNQVVFLFVGARFFSDLQQPNWNEYFVQVKHLRVDYLKRPDVLHLIQHPTPDFGLVYADDLANRIFDLTQGHPALVQQICSEMVNLANMTNHRQMTHDDLDQVLREKTLFRENLTIQIFWTQFCAPAERATVKQILAGETPTDPVSRYRLELHGYIVKEGDNWTMRVPLFEQWLRKYIETFPI